MRHIQKKTMMTPEMKRLRDWRKETDIYLDHLSSLILQPMTPPVGPAVVVPVRWVGAVLARRVVSYFHSR